MSLDDPGDPGDLADPVPLRPVGPRPLGALGDLAELLAGDSQRSRRFLGGIGVGALVGAAIAGSTIWRRMAKAKRESRRHV